ncbi:MAG: hypothetical protein K2N01_00225 [Lachnospiraceae bacterium]|nr:hypothetical protein [Lachnospiraceae bacterium]
MKKKRKLWVKLAALTLALALLWINMADVRNIVNANAGSEELQTDTEDISGQDEPPLDGEDEIETEQGDTTPGGEKVNTPNQDATDDESFTVTVDGFDMAEATGEQTVTLTVTTSSAADGVKIVLGVEGSDEQIPVEKDSVKDAGDGKTWTVELPVSEYTEWTVGTKVYVSSVTATKDGKKVNGIVSNSEGDESSVSAENAKYSFTVVGEEGNPGGDGNEPDDPKKDPEGNDNDSDDPKKDPEDTKGADVTKPVIEAIVIDKQGKPVTDGETVKITISAYDMGDGVENIHLELKNEYSDYSYGVDVAYDETTKKGEAVLDVSAKDWLKGKVYIYNVTVTDQMGNCAYGEVDLGSSDFKYASVDSAKHWFIADRKGVDVQKPEIKKVELTPNGFTVEPKGQVEIKVMATDDVALKLEKGCRAYFSCGGVHNVYSRKDLYLDWDQEEKCYCGTLEITGQLYPGEWRLNDVRVWDAADNYSDLYPENITFTIQNEDYDKEMPKVQSVQMEKTGEVLQAGESVLLSVEATDNQGIEYVDVCLWAVSGDSLSYTSGSRIIRLNRVENTDRYEGIFKIDDQTYPCEWYVKLIRIQDKSGNYQEIESCTSGEYEVYYYDGPYSEDSYSLEERFYVLVADQKGDVIRPDVRVWVYGLVKTGEDSWWYDDFGRAIQVPRRATLEEVQKLCGTAETPDGLVFEGWMSTRGSSDNSKDPMILWKGNSVRAKYDKNLVILNLCDADGNTLYSNVIFGEEGQTLALPKDISGLCNIKWEDWVDGERIVVDNVIVTSDPVYYVSGTAELDADNPATPPAPITPDTPVRPPYAEPVALPGQKIAEVVAEIAAAGNGATITVAMGDATVVPKDILEAAKGKDVDVVLQMDGYTWTINGKNILSENLKDINLRVIRNTEYIPSGLISQLAGDNPVEQITLEYDGDFGFKADLTMNIGSQYAGKSGNLYWHDSDGRMIFMNAGAIDVAGNVTLGFSHASDYAIVITGPAATIVPNTAVASVSTSAAVTPKTGDELPVVPYAAVCAVGFVGILITGVVIKKRHGK